MTLIIIILVNGETHCHAKKRIFSLAACESLSQCAIPPVPAETLFGTPKLQQCYPPELPSIEMYGRRSHDNGVTDHVTSHVILTSSGERIGSDCRGSR